MSEAQEAEIEDAFISEWGRITSHSSEAYGPPDVGMTLGLGDGRTLWCGEISKARHAEAGDDAAALGDDFGWWIILFWPERNEVIAKCVNPYVASEMLETIAAAMRKDG